MTPIDFTLRSEWISLDAFVKACGVAASGGQAKWMIQSGSVQVDGEAETRRSRKLRAGQQVQVGGRSFFVRSAGSV